MILKIPCKDCKENKSDKDFYLINGKPYKSCKKCMSEKSLHRYKRKKFFLAELGED